MALISCKACGHQISPNAKACPECGEAPPKRTGIVGWTFAIVVAVSMVTCVSSGGRKDTAASAPEITPAQSKVQEARRKVEDFESNARFACMKAIKQFLKDPSSAKFENEYTAPVTLTDKGKAVVTMDVRAQNSFGAFAITRMRCDGKPSNGDLVVDTVTQLK